MVQNAMAKKVHNANGVNKNNDRIVNVITNNVIFVKEMQNYQMNFCNNLLHKL